MQSLSDLLCVVERQVDGPIDNNLRSGRKPGARFPCSLFFRPQRVERLLRVHKVGRDLQGLLVGIERLGDAAGLRQRAAEFEIALGRKLQFHGSGESADRFIEFALLLREKAQPQPGIELVGIEAQ